MHFCDNFSHTSQPASVAGTQKYFLSITANGQTWVQFVVMMIPFPQIHPLRRFPPPPNLLFMENTITDTTAVSFFLSLFHTSTWVCNESWVITDLPALESDDWYYLSCPGQTWVRSRSRLWLHEAGFQASGSRLRLPDFKKAWLWLWLLALRKPRLRLRVCGFGSVWYIIPPVNSCWNDMYCFLWANKYTKNYSRSSW